MGICLSCLKPNVENDIDENTPLINNDDNLRILEHELSMEIRHKELNNILNSTNDHLIDISNFNSNSNSNLNSNSNSNSNLNSNIDQDDNEMIKIEVLNSDEVNNEVEAQLKNWETKFGKTKLNKLINIEVKNNLPLKIEFI